VADAFTIRILVPDGDPESIKIIHKMNWTGKGVAFPRPKWADVRLRHDVEGTGVYILWGKSDDDGAEADDAPHTNAITIYIGESETIEQRIAEHDKDPSKDFWDKAIVFVSTNSSAQLNRAHARWLEHQLIERARNSNQCKINNGEQKSKEPTLSESDKADTQHFLKELLQVLPLVGLRVFETDKVVATPKTSTLQSTTTTAAAKQPVDEIDTIIVPARRAAFDEIFLGENCWYAIRISGGKLDKIKYIACYQVAPIQAITHYAPVDRIEPHGDEGKYKVVFSEPAKPIDPLIPLGDTSQVAMMGPKYTTFAKLKSAKKLGDLLLPT
jgi:hypothetical protein